MFYCMFYFACDRFFSDPCCIFSYRFVVGCIGIGVIDHSCCGGVPSRLVGVADDCRSASARFCAPCVTLPPALDVMYLSLLVHLSLNSIRINACSGTDGSAETNT